MAISTFDCIQIRHISAEFAPIARLDISQNFISTQWIMWIARGWPSPMWCVDDSTDNSPWYFDPIVEIFDYFLRGDDNVFCRTKR